MSRFLCLTLLLTTSLSLSASDWPRFRGPMGKGVATDSDSLPTRWSPTANVAWKSPLPGPGASSPIIVGDRAFVTCYSGYGLDQASPGDIEKLMRHIVCVDINTGKKLWQKDVKAALPEDPYSGVGVTAHGYASHTPVSDGTHVFAFFGKSGVYAFDMDGNQVWQTGVGQESDPTKWGSSSSPILYDNTVIVTASAESQAIIGLDKSTGKELWRQEAEMLDGMWGTPTMVPIDGDRTDLVLGVSKEFWGLDPTNGKMRWMAKATGAEHAYASVVPDGKRIYAITGRGGGSVAVDIDGSGDISESQTAWSGTTSGSFGSPVLLDGKLYSIASNIVTIVDAKTGKTLERLRLKGVAAAAGRFGALDYPSPVVAAGKVFYLNSRGQMFVLQPGEKTEQIALNVVTADTEVFRGTPAISNGKMFLRSSKHLYCVTDKGDQVSDEEVIVAATEEEPAAGRGGPGGGGNRQRFDPMSMFKQIDKNSDEKITMDELEGNRMADRLKELDKDSDGSITAEEFRTNISSLFRRGGGGGGGGGGRGGYGERKDSRPDRPVRPEMAG